MSDDAIAILLLCSNLATKNINFEYKPYTVSQWNKLTEKLICHNYSPKDLFQIDKIAKDLDIDDTETTRIKKLLTLSGNISIAISQLNSIGISIITRADKNYPKIYKSKLKKLCPPVLYYSGELSLFNNNNIAIVGSRNVDKSGIDFAQKFSIKCCNEKYNIVSGGAKGVDTIAEESALNNNGNVIVIVADNMKKKIRNKNIRDAIINGHCIIMSAVHPEESFKVYNAMDRNKYIYAASKYALVVSSDYKKGGTWTGAIENHKKGWSKLLVRKGNNIPTGNQKLLEITGIIPIEEIKNNLSIEQYINSFNTEQFNQISVQMKLF